MTRLTAGLQVTDAFCRSPEPERLRLAGIFAIPAGSYVERKPLADPDAAARKLVEIANDIEAVQDGRIYIERVNEPFLAAGGSGEQFRAGIERALALG